MINLLYEDSFQANVFRHVVYKRKKDCSFYNRKLDRVASYELCLLNDIKLINTSDDVDFFIYPIMLDEPYYHIRHFINPDHPSFGILSMIDPSVASKINNGHGVIYVSMSFEPPNYQELLILCNSLKGDKRFILNVMYPELAEANIYCLPGHNEASENNEIPEFKIHNILGDAAERVSTQKDFSFLNIRAEKHIAACVATYYLDSLNLLQYANYSFNEDMVKAYNIANNNKISKILFNTNFTPYQILGNSKSKILSETLSKSTLNLVVEAYYEELSFEKPFFTEKIWRNIYWEKPFILIGQRNSLEKFRQLGYRTFHPYINETYDSLPDDIRVFKAIQEVKKFVKLSDVEKTIFLNNLKPIFNHNKNNFKKRIQKLNSVLENARYQ